VHAVLIFCSRSFIADLLRTAWLDSEWIESTAVGEMSQSDVWPGQHLPSALIRMLWSIKALTRPSADKLTSFGPGRLHTKHLE